MSKAQIFLILLFFHTVYDRNRQVERATKRKFHEMIVQLNPVLAMGFLMTGLQVATRQAMFVRRNIDACSCNHCCSEKAMCYMF